MSDMQRLRDYLNPGGWRVYEQIKAETRAEHYDINLKWLSEILIDEHHFGVAAGTRPTLPKKEIERPTDWRSQMFCLQSLESHITDLEKAGAVLVTTIAKHRCIAAIMPPKITITDQMLSDRRESRVRLKLEHYRVDGLLARAFA